MVEKILDIRTESLSGGQYGEAMPIDGVVTAPQTVHNITADDVVDAVWLGIHNATNQPISVGLVLNADDSSSQSSRDDSTVEIVIPGDTGVYALQGNRFRKHGSGNNTATIAVYVDAGDVDDLRFVGYVNRYHQPEETA